MLSKPLIQFSADGWVCAVSLLAVWPEETKGPSKRAHANMCLPGPLLPVPLSPLQAAANPHIHRAPTKSQAGLAQSLVGHVSFSLGPCAHKVLFVPSKCFCFIILWKLCNQILLSFKVRSLGIPRPFARSPVGKSDVEPRTFTIVWELLGYYCSPFCEFSTQQVWDLILTWLHPFCHFVEASSSSLNVYQWVYIGKWILYY